MLQTARVVLLQWTALALLAGGAAGQDLKVQSEDGVVKTLAASELAALPHRVLDVSDHGKPVKFDAIPLKAVLERAGVPLGDSLRGKRKASCLLVQAADGYTAVIALAEIEPAFTTGEVFLADGRDHKPLDPGYWGSPAGGISDRGQVNQLNLPRLHPAEDDLRRRHPLALSSCHWKTTRPETSGRADWGPWRSLTPS